MRAMKAILVCGTIISSAAVHTAVMAQTTPAEPATNESATAAAAESGVGDIIVTAQKRAENLQDVPIAVSAFSQEALESQGLVGGSDLQRSIPNVSFTSTGFNRYNFQIRGIGAQIQGFSVDTGVGIHQNNIPLTSNRLADAEFFDVERVEVLRGPQGTLYGRNATGGVVNTITAQPTDTFSGEITGEYGSFDTRRLRGFLNVPIGDAFAVRAAGTMIKRDGTTFNQGTGNHVESRDIWSTRLTAAWTPTDSVKATAMWEHFDEDDSRGGSAKIICAPDAGPTSIGGVATNPLTQAFLSKGCQNTTLYDPANTGAISSLSTIPGLFGALGGFQAGNAFAGKTLSRDIRTVESTFDPRYTAKSDLASFLLEVNPTEAITITSLTSYHKDRFSGEIYTFGAVPTSGLSSTPLTPGGVFTDPQLGTSSLMESRFLNRQNSRQYSQELRAQSAFAGPFNFNLGGIYLDYKQDNDVIALANTITAFAQGLNFGGAGIYIDPLANPDGTGHNYYNNKGPYQLKSAAAFGEAYWQATDTVKATLGLRYTNDLKKQITYPVLLLVPGQGFPATPQDKVRFEEVTGRFTLDWSPEVSFTDSTLFYASGSRGYKGGGFNPGATALAGVPKTFKPEFVNSIEVGTKNTLLDRRLVLNLTGFYYDYKGYQIAKNVNQSISNENVDATIKGLEFESIYEPVDRLKFNLNVGYLDSKIKSGSSIDSLDRTQGDPTLAQVRSIDSGSFSQNCVVPVAVLAGVQAAINGGLAPSEAMASLCSGPFASPFASAGIPVNLKGKQLPSAPHWTLSLGGEYEMQFGADWTGTFRADYYVQSKSYFRVYNSIADKVRGYDNLNLSYRIASEDKGLNVLLYARNLLSSQAIASAQVTDDSLGPTRLIYPRDRRTYGIALTKSF